MGKYRRSDCRGKIMGGALALLIHALPVQAQSPKPAQDSVPAADPKIWINYDLVPGSRVIFFTDYSDDQAKGLGSTKPAVPNTTVEGRQTNRRVVLVKI